MEIYLTVWTALTVHDSESHLSNSTAWPMMKNTFQIFKWSKLEVIRMYYGMETDVVRLLNEQLT